MNPFNTRVPLVKVTDAVLDVVKASARVTVNPGETRIFREPMVLPLDVMVVPLPPMLKLRPVNVPPVDNVTLPERVKSAVPIVDAIVPKSIFL